MARTSSPWLEAIGYDERIGHRFLNAGLGFGGGCLPKDIRAFTARAGELGVSGVQLLLRQVDEINMGRRQRTAELAREMLGGSLLGRNVAVLGCAFKPNSDDVRDSPALNVAAALQLQGAQVRVHDPRATDNARAVFPTLDYTTDIMKACEQADLVLHLTEWAEYRELDAARLAEVVRAPAAAGRAQRAGRGGVAAGGVDGAVPGASVGVAVKRRPVQRPLPASTQRPPAASICGRAARTSAVRSETNSSTTSGRAATSASGEMIGMSVPGIRRPCLSGEASATAVSRLASRPATRSRATARDAAQ